MINNIKKWIKKNKNDFIILVFILAIGAFVRLFNIDGYMTFLGDEGRDAIIVRRLLVNFDPILIGPGTSIGNMYLGPLYYYLMAPFLLLFNFSPVGPSVMVALFGVATIFFVWYVARLWFGKAAGVVSALLYALSPVIIIYSRSSWNPNIMPFFAMLTMFSLWKVWNDGKFKWMMAMGISLAFVLQSHYLGLLLVPTILIFLCIKLFALSKSVTLEKRNFWRNTIFAGLLFIFLMSPLLIFDIRHNWMNFNAIRTFFTQRETTVSIKPWKAIPNIYPILRDNVIHRIVAGQNIFAGKVSVYAIVLPSLLFVVSSLSRLRKLLFENNERDIFDRSFLFLLVWIGVGLVGLGLYKQHVYDHYFGFLYPAFFLLIGAIYQKILDLHFDGLKIIVTAWVILLIGSYIVRSPLRGVPNYQMRRAQDVADVIRKDAGSSKFNLAVIAQQNYEDGYQYFLERAGSNVVDIDAQKLSETVGEFLYVVCEMPEDKCDPTHSPKAEVANFGWSRIVNKWGREGVTIFKLAHVTS